jgi:hypothetical protein
MEERRGMIGKNELSTIQMEYASHRQDIREIVKSMDTNFNIAVTMITGLIALASFIKDERLVYLIPTIIFLSTCVHLLKTATVNINGAYCQAIESLLLEHLDGKKVMLNWEGGVLFKDVASPGGIVWLGFYFFFGVIAILFASVVVLTYIWQQWTIFVHILELIVLLYYAFICGRWNTKSHRERIVKELNNLRVTRSNINLRNKTIQPRDKTSG